MCSHAIQLKVGATPPPALPDAPQTRKSKPVVLIDMT